MAQMKEQDKTRENQLNEMETSNLSDTNFKTLVIMMLNERSGWTDEFSENLNKEIETMKKNYSEMKNTMNWNKEYIR